MKKIGVVAVTVLSLGLMASPMAAVAQQAMSTTVPADQQPSKEQLAKLFELMRVKEQFAATTKMMPAMVQQQFGEQLQAMQKDYPGMGSLSDEQKQALQKVMARYMEKAMSVYSADEVVADMSELYQQHLTRTDVDSIITFYGSPAGQHMLDVVPVIMQEFLPKVMRKSQERMRPLIMEMTKEMADAVKAAPTTKK